MALQKTHTTQAGVTVDNAYCRISSLNLIDKVNCLFYVDILTSPESSVPLERITQQGRYSLTGENILKQMYLEAKQGAIFADAVDV
jgi:hypothetical protein